MKGTDKSEISLKVEAKKDNLKDQNRMIFKNVESQIMFKLNNFFPIKILYLIESVESYKFHKLVIIDLISEEYKF